MWMFENNPNEACIPQKEYEKICGCVMQEQIQKNQDVKNDFLIGNYFRLVKHCEGIETGILYFVHRSIYEYFVSEYILASIKNSIQTYGSKEQLAGAFGSILKRNHLSKEILEFLKYKIKNSEVEKSYDLIQYAFQLMIQDGMTYYTNESYKNVIECELNIFANMLAILQLWESCPIKLKGEIHPYIGNNNQIVLDLSKADLSRVKLSRANLKGAKLRKANLSGVDLSGANLSGADLYNAELIRADLTGADLSNADLRGADLSRAKLSRADLSNTDLINADLNGVDLRGADLSNADLSGASLSRVKLSRSNLSGTNLRGANLSGSNLSGADLSRSKTFDKTIFDDQNIDVIMRNVPTMKLIRAEVIIEKERKKINFLNYIEKYSSEEMN